MSVSAVIITLNEENNIRDCIKCTQWADETIVVDGGSEDRTVEIAKDAGANVFSIPFTDFATQKNEAINKAAHEWVLMLDADERIPGDLARKLGKICVRDKGDHVYAIKRLTYFFNRPLKFSGTQRDYPIRLIPKGKAVMTQPVHEEVKTDLKTRYIEDPIIHFSTQDFDHYKLKLKRYLPFEQKILSERAAKPNILTLLVKPVGKFVQIYFLQLGILDGLTGFQYAALSSYYVYLKYYKYLFKSKERNKSDGQA